VKKAGDLLSVVLDKKTLGIAKGYSRLFSAWEQLTKKYGIAAAADHSRVIDLKRGVLLIETDHPGWTQIIQTREQELLSDLHNTFPELKINGIAFVLSKTPPDFAGETAAKTSPGAVVSKDISAKSVLPAHKQESIGPAGDTGLNSIRDGVFKDKLKNLEKTIILQTGA
jgi:hypothetical protein